MKKKFLLPLALMLLMPLAACGGKSIYDLDDPSDLLAKTPVTDSMKLNLDYQGKKFAHEEGGTSDHIGKVTVKSYTDGDTTNFTEEGYNQTIKLRYLGVNTPESTAKVEPWGKKASNFTKHVLETAYEVVLVNDPDSSAFEEFDGSGGRWLGFVWYRRSATEDFRCLNLEIVEQAYSINYLFEDSEKCPYLKYFMKAEANAKKYKIRVHGTPDPDWHDDEPVDASIRQIRDHYDEYGISEEGSSGLPLIITGLVVGLIGDSPILKDVRDPDPDTGEYATMYGYTGYGSGLASLVHVGDVVKFKCRATKFSDNIQLSGINTKTSGKYKMEIWSPEHIDEETGELVPADEGYENFPTDTTPVDLTNEEFRSYSDFVPYDGLHVKINLTVRYVTPKTDDDQDEESGEGQGEQYYYKKSDKGAMTVYAWANEQDKIALNIRQDATVYPKVNENNFEVGHTYSVIGYIQKYFEKYQIMIYNQVVGMNYIVDVTQ